jgi:hypothetical protein
MAVTKGFLGRRGDADPSRGRRGSSARSLELLIYREELMEMEPYDLLDVSVTLTWSPGQLA